MKTITSPVAHFPGTVDLPDFYSFGELIPWAENIDRLPVTEEGHTNTTAENLRYLQIQADAVLPLVECFHIAGLPEHPTKLPAKPIGPAVELVGWLFGEISRIVNDDEVISPFTEGASTPG